MLRLALLALALVLLGSEAYASCPAVLADCPNIIVVLADDLPARAVGAYGTGGDGVNFFAVTPNIDALATAGWRATDGVYVTAVCTPSRVALLTGRAPWQTGVYSNGTALDPATPTLMDSLVSAGYKTHMIGKQQTPPMTGADLGWSTRKYCSNDECNSYTNSTFITCTTPDNSACSAPAASSGNVTDVIEAEGQTYIDARTPGVPFFLYLAHKATHSPFIASSAGGELNSVTSTFPEPTTFNDDWTGRSKHVRYQWLLSMLSLYNTWCCGVFTSLGKNVPPSEVVNGTDAAKESWVYQEYAQDVTETTRTLDRNIGLLTAYLAAEPLVSGDSGFSGCSGAGCFLAANTVVIFASDNGLAVGENNRQGKFRTYTQMNRMVLAMRGPGITPGTTSAAMVTTLDLAPTILDLAGIAQPAAMHGRSLMDLIPGPASPAWRPGVFSLQTDPDGQKGIRQYSFTTPDCVLIREYMEVATAPEAEWELIDRLNDPGDLTNVYGNPPASCVIATLKTQMAAEQAALGFTGFMEQHMATRASGLLP